MTAKELIDLAVQNPLDIGYASLARRVEAVLALVDTIVADTKEGPERTFLALRIKRALDGEPEGER